IWCHDASDGSVPQADGAAWCRGWLTLALAS
ncbi:MAG: nitric oxide synthase, partial [Burkholderiaceae bacterium]|nr:nitric oxide synthase [Burkholderiaceae bacterium]